MSGKSDKKLRRMQRKFNKEIFSEFVVEVAAMPFLTRLWFCLKMAFNRHKLQSKLKDRIKARKELIKKGKNNEK